MNTTRYARAILIGLSLFIISCIALSLTGCQVRPFSAQWHIKKAIYKDPSLQQEIVDTIKLSQIVVDTVHTSDSTYYIEQRIIHYDTIVKYTKVQADFTEFKNWFTVWQEEKTNRRIAKEDRKVDRTDIRQNNKTERTTIRQNNKTERGRSWWWLWLLIGAGGTVGVWFGLQ